MRRGDAGPRTGALVLLGVAAGAAVLAQRTAAQVRALRAAGAGVAPLDHEVTVPGRGRVCELAVLGDSAAAGHGLPHADVGLGRQVARRLSAADGRPIHVTSVATDGATTVDVADEQVPALPVATEVVVVGVGVNDAVRGRSPGRVLASTRRLAEAIRRQAPRARIVLLTCPDLASAPGLPPLLRPVLGRSCRRVARAQRRAAAELGVEVVDADGPLPVTAFGPDGIHPGSEGVAMLADRVAARLVPAAHRPLS